jgi:hypothetical protein
VNSGAIAKEVFLATDMTKVMVEAGLKAPSTTCETFVVMGKECGWPIGPRRCAADGSRRHARQVGNATAGRCGRQIGQHLKGCFLRSRKQRQGYKRPASVMALRKANRQTIFTDDP